MSSATFRFVALSVVKHDYVPIGMAAHPRFEPVVVADDPDQPNRVHQRNEKFAQQFNLPYIRDVERAISDFDVQVAVVSSEAERHCDLSVRAANAGLHVVQDKPMSTQVSECDRVVEAVDRNQVKFLLWNSNYVPAVLQARKVLESGKIGEPYAFHIDFFFAKDAGPPRRRGDSKMASVDWLEQMNPHESHVSADPMGELKIEGIYPLAYLRMLSGVEVRRVFARTTAHFHQACVDNDIEDLATVTLEMDKGIIGTLCIGRIGSASRAGRHGIKIHVLGSDGALVINQSSPAISVYYRGQSKTDSPYRGIGGDSSFLLAEDFVQAIDTDGETILNARAGRAICATVQAAIDSGRFGKPVDVT